MSILVLAGKIAGTTALAAGALVAGVHATDASTSSTKTHTVHCARFGHASPDLKAAIKKIRAMPKGDDRRRAVVALRKDVRAGKYGKAAQLASYKREARRLRLLAKAPDSLKTDLKAARAEPAGDDRRAALKAVWQDAAAGKYGDDVQKAAKRAVAHVEACAAKRHHATGSASPSASASS